jgi:hypothetical protein
MTTKEQLSILDKLDAKYYDMCISARVHPSKTECAKEYAELSNQLRRLINK